MIAITPLPPVLWKNARSMTLCLHSLAIAMILSTGTPARAITVLKPGQTAPPILLKDLSGQRRSLASLKASCVVLTFGELYHSKTLNAVRWIQRLKRDPRFKGKLIRNVLIVAEDRPVTGLQMVADRENVQALILHDPRRSAFGAYQVTVMPSVVVLDAKDIIVHVEAGWTSRFKDVIQDAMLVATGDLQAKYLDKTLRTQISEGISVKDRETEVRADRLSKLADQLAQRNRTSLAIQKYREALKIKPNHERSLLGLAHVALTKHRLADAEARFAAVLQSNPRSVPAGLGLAYIQAQRGGREWAQAESLLHKIIAQHPTLARAYYLLGQVQEQQQNLQAALASYKKASALLLEQHTQEELP